MEQQMVTDAILKRFRDLAEFAPSELETLAEHPAIDIRVQVASHHNCPDHIASKLADDPAWQVLQALAGNPVSSLEVLQKLAEHDEWCVRLEVAGNSSSPTELLSQLADDSDEGVQAKVADNPNCPEDVFWDFVVAGDMDIQKCCYENPACPLPVLLHGCKDYDADLRDIAKQAIQNTSHDVWARHVAEGLSLDKPLPGHDSARPLGNELLVYGLTQAYQAIQGIELQVTLDKTLVGNISMLTSEAPHSANSLRAKFRM